MIVLVAAPALAGSKIARQKPEFDRQIAVQLALGAEVRIGVRGDAVIECYRGVKLSEIYYFSSEISLLYLPNGIELNDENGAITIGLTEIVCRPRYASSIMEYNGKGFRGYIKATFQDSPEGINIVNIVDIEDYLKGVLPGEIGDRTPEEYEAVKAQAVAARTYAVWKLTDRETSGRLVPTVADQLYTGVDTEKEFLSRGVDETLGQVITYKGKPIAAYYHAVCGGHTAPIEKVWPEKKPTHYLAGADDDSNCAWARSFSWSETFTLPKLKEALEKYFLGRNGVRAGDFDSIIDINFIADTLIGRIQTMEIKTSTGIFSENDDHIRWVLGRPSNPGAILPSTRFHAIKEIENGRLAGVKIDGTGNGHGAGMCQCGAIGQARAGEKYVKILQHYYKDVEVVKYYK